MYFHVSHSQTQFQAELRKADGCQTLLSRVGWGQPCSVLPGARSASPRRRTGAPPCRRCSPWSLGLWPALWKRNGKGSRKLRARTSCAPAGTSLIPASPLQRKSWVIGVRKISISS